jgi:hypothetical protein
LSGVNVDSDDLRKTFLLLPNNHLNHLLTMSLNSDANALIALIVHYFVPPPTPILLLTAAPPAPAPVTFPVSCPFVLSPSFSDHQSQIGSHVFWWDINGTIKYSTVCLCAMMNDINKFILVGDAQTDCLSFQGMMVAYVKVDGVPCGERNSVVALPVSSFSGVT